MNLLSQLNPEQQRAVEIVEGPVLVLAGPGSGKTRVLTYRVAYLVEEIRLAPHNLLAVTFTNKAAREMRDRLTRLIGEDKMRDLTIGTFHAICARFLRRDGEAVGLAPGFVIFDDDDQAKLIQEIIREQNINDKVYRPGQVLAAISKAKNELIGPEEYVPATYWHEAVGRIYKRYQQKLLDNNAVDFDDLLNYTVQLLRDHPAILQKYQRRYVYLHVDEFQDTNFAQYLIVKLLAGKYKNIFCVGDEDQSIYAWRGADYRNVMRFREDFPDARIVLLEQNYRSTQTILDVAQAIIRRNPTRTPKHLWTENPRGIPVEVIEAYDDREEPQWVAQEINRLLAQGKYKPKDFAVFYRTRAQSRILGEEFFRRGIPYKVIGARGFYELREVKDLLAYLRLLHNPRDTVSFNRILNVPPRGIGKRTHEDLGRVAEKLGVSPVTALKMLRDDEDAKNENRETTGENSATEFPYANYFDARARRALIAFFDLLVELNRLKDELTLTEFFDALVEKIGYREYLVDGTREGDDRWGNVQELRKATQEHSALDSNVALAEFLETAALVSDVDAHDENEGVVALMTLHMAKGLEFPVVFITGMEEGIFPHARSFDEPHEMEEERRLAYVGITRAKEKLYLLYAFRRSSFGNVAEPTEPSRFLTDIPRHLVKTKSGEKRNTYDEILNTRKYKEMTTWETEGKRQDTDDKSRKKVGNVRRNVPPTDDAQTRVRRNVPPTDDAQTRVRRNVPPTDDDVDDETATRKLGAARSSFTEKPKPARASEWKPGDKVTHPTFGDGTIISSKVTGNDEELQVAFEGAGVKRLLAAYAKLTRR
jgi:DNA helicase-2/ATP-dependent DNA helicase PcrA